MYELVSTYACVGICVYRHMHTVRAPGFSAILRSAVLITTFRLATGSTVSFCGNTVAVTPSLARLPVSFSAVGTCIDMCTDMDG